VDHQGFHLFRNPNETDHCPVFSAFTNAEDKTRDHLLALCAVSDLRMELDAIDGLCVMSDGGKRSSLCLTDDMEILGEILELISVRHPDLVS